MVTQNVLRMYDRSFLERVRFVSAFDLMKCLKHIKLKKMLLTRAPVSELPSNIGTMVGPRSPNHCISRPPIVKSLTQKRDND